RSAACVVALARLGLLAPGLLRLELTLFLRKPLGANRPLLLSPVAGVPRMFFLDLGSAPVQLTRMFVHRARLLVRLGGQIGVGVCLHVARGRPGRPPDGPARTGAGGSSRTWRETTAGGANGRPRTKSRTTTGWCSRQTPAPYTSVVQPDRLQVVSMAGAIPGHVPNETCGLTSRVVAATRPYARAPRVPSRQHDLPAAALRRLRSGARGRA